MQPPQPTKRGRTADLRFRCTDRFKERLRAYCDAEELDMSDVIRAAVTEYLERRGAIGRERGQ